MKTVGFKFIAAALADLIMLSACLVGGCLNRLLFIPAVFFAAIYIIIDRRYLRCPNCGSFTNIDRLLYAKNHIYHCHGCGERITVE